MSERETKRIDLALKADDDGAPPGAFVATFSRFDVIDLHGDVTLKNAFQEGAEVLVGGWNHNRSELPVGKGVLVTDDDVARVDGQFFLDTPQGEATYNTVKALGGLTEFSYVFSITDAEFGEFIDPDGKAHDVRFLKGLDVVSVDPVDRGAGIGTGTDRVKSTPLPYQDDGEALREELARFIKRTEARAEMRAKADRQLGADDRTRGTALLAGLEELAKRLEDVLREPVTKQEIDVSQEFLRYQRFLAASHT